MALNKCFLTLICTPSLNMKLLRVLFLQWLTVKCQPMLDVFQVLPDYLKALLSVVPQGKPSEQHMQQIARLAALQHRAKDSIYLPTL